MSLSDGLLRSFSSLGCPDYTLEQTLALAARHGLGAVELRALGGTVELTAYLAKTYGSPEELADRLRGERLRIVALGTSLRLVGHSAADRDAFLDFVPWAEALEVPWLRVFDAGTRYEEAELAEAVANVRWWQALRRERGWRTDILVETHDALTNTPAIQRFLAAIPDVGLLWDTHHTWKKAGEDPVATWRAISGRVRHIHVKDSVGRPSARHPFTYVLPGEGDFPLGPLLAELRSAKYPGAISLEWEKLWHPYLPALEEALATATAKGWW